MLYFTGWLLLVKSLDILIAGHGSALPSIILLLLLSLHGIFQEFYNPPGKKV